MKIVIISGWAYPSSTPRSFRATELAKYLAKAGHDVTHYFMPVEGFDYAEYVKQTGIKVKSLGKTKYVKSPGGATHAMSLLRRARLKLLNKLIEFPMIELAFKTYDILKECRHVDLLITIAYPFPIHWGAAWAKKKMGDEFPKKWISDCGDPYMGNSVHKPLPYFQLVEDFWGRQTDYITIPIEEGRKAYSKKVQDKIRIIPQGFDFSNIRIDTSFGGNEIPHFIYAGIVYKGYRDPSAFLEYLCRLKTDFRFIVYTKSKEAFNAYKGRLGEKLVINDYIPRDELIYKMSQMDFLINLLNNNSVQSPSKLIDYALSGRPILDISSSFAEKENFDNFMKGDYSNKHAGVDVQKYNIENVGKQFLELAR